MVAPSFLSADFANLQRDVERMNASCADWFHLDVMDGVFVPNISFGFPVLQAIAKWAVKPLDVHLMIVQPDKFVSQVRDLGAGLMTVHAEACTHLHRTLQQIRQAGMQAGVALNPATPLAAVEEVLGDADVVLLMAVNPGFGGQKFIPQSLNKVERLRRMIDAQSLPTLIEVDGGVNAQNALALYAAGADLLVAGSAVFGADDPVAAVAQLQNHTATERG